MNDVRPAAVAGMFYPANPAVLKAEVSAMLEEAADSPVEPVALIVPHAGYVYSGPVAASAFVALRNIRHRVERVVVIGPAHREFVRGLAVPSCDAFATPLGDVPLDREQIDRLLQLPFVHTRDSAHAEEHCLEVELPFLQAVLDSFTLVPILIGDAGSEQVADVIDICLQTPNTFLVVSSDLSHYLGYESARKLDTRTVRAIEQLQPSNIQHEQACGRVPILGLITCAQRHGWWVRAVDYRNSGDTAGSKDRVVGYGAFLVSEERTHG